MFGDLIIWGLWAFATWIFIFKPTVWKLTLSIVLAFLLVPALHESKLQLRRQVLGYENAEGNVNMSSFDKTKIWSSFLANSLQDTVTGSLNDESIGEIVSRYNQGWIIDRVMQTVPVSEPYARGETLKDALISAVVPRIFYPDKVMTGGQVNIFKYAGLRLSVNTSMNLGFAGEMYANFGYWGGIIGCGFYCLGIALVFRVIAKRSLASPLWWSVMPYIGFVTFKAEDDIVGVLNWITKSFVMILVVCWIFPAFRRALFSRQGQSAQIRNSAPEIRARKSKGRVLTVDASQRTMPDREK